MTTGGDAVQNTLAAEAAALVRYAVTLARRQGHAQVTPLHVASAMLSVPGLLRAACLQSHPHPFQCNALELCFNVALNRLPTAAAVANVHHVGYDAPVLSKALVAALKRAKALQRRGGSTGSQQRPSALAVKVMLEQLILSILDDPSVSRVMCEAGLSSSQVKANVETAVSNMASSKCTPPNLLSHNNPKETKAKADDAMRVLDCMASGRARSVVVVGETAAAAAGVVKLVMDKVSKGELQRQHECLKNPQFVSLSIASFQHMAREEVQAKASDLRALVRAACVAGKGVVLILQDLSYAAEAWAAVSSEKRKGGRGHSHYSPVEHAVIEVSSLVRGGRSFERFCLLGFGTYPSYSNCRAGQPALAAIWELHPIVVPDGDLVLSLRYDSERQASETRSRTGWPGFVGTASGNNELKCCGIGTVKATTTSLPSWLHRYQDPVLCRSAGCDTTLQPQDLCSGSALRSTNFGSEHTLTFSSSATASPEASSISRFTNNCFTNMSSKPLPLALFPQPRQPWPNHRHDYPMAEPYHQRSNANPKQDYTSAWNSSDGTTEAAACRRPKFTELTAENLKILCMALEMRVPRHKEIAPDIACTVLRCRSGGMLRRMGRRERPSSATWLIFQGRDSGGKKAMARELAKLVFGSYIDFTSITITELIPVNSNCSSSRELTLKRKRSPGNEHRYVQSLYEAIRDNPHRVIMIDGVEKWDYDSETGIKNVIAEGRIRGCNGDVILLEDVIVVLTCEVFDSRSRASSPRVIKPRVIRKDGEEEDSTEKEVKSHFVLDLNACAEDGEVKEGNSLDVDILNAVDGVFSFRLTDGY